MIYQFIIILSLLLLKTVVFLFVMYLKIHNKIRFAIWKTDLQIQAMNIMITMLWRTEKVKEKQ